MYINNYNYFGSFINEEHEIIHHVVGYSCHFKINYAKTESFYCNLIIQIGFFGDNKYACTLSTTFLAKNNNKFLSGTLL